MITQGELLAWSLIWCVAVLAWAIIGIELWRGRHGR